MAVATLADQSLADYDSAFYIAVGSAWLLALVGCYAALRVAGDDMASQTVAVLAPLLAVSPLIARLVGVLIDQSVAFGTLTVVGVVLYILVPAATPLIARFVVSLHRARV